MFKINRRQFLQFTGGLAIGTIGPDFYSQLGAMEIPEPKIQIRAWNPEGQPLDKKLLSQLYFLDLNDEPLPALPWQVQAGLLSSQIPSFPFALALRFPVEGFGEVTLYGDNEGNGYTSKDFPLDLNLTFARSRLYRVRQAISLWSQGRIKFPSSIETRLQKAEIALQRAETTTELLPRVKLCNESLKESLWAGEEAVFIKAKQEIIKRSNFLFGCNFFGYPSAGKDYNRLFKELFNFATVPFYWKNFEAKEGEKNFAAVDSTVEYLEKANIIPKGHPLVWFHEIGIPDWFQKKSYEQMQESLKRRVYEITTYYGNKIPYYDVINEANGIPWANDLGYSLEQLVELTRVVAQAAKKDSPEITRIINSCCLWAENVAYNPPPQSSPYQYLKTCLAAEIPFEVIGLQLYYPDRDMFEIDRLLDRFSKLGKPIHITELGVSSSTECDEGSYLKEVRGLWHSPWSEIVQADWIEQFYTLCYSKPYIQAISWWDFADRGNFWPHGGLLDRNMQPKESFYRLENLLSSWK
jgi:GH35 family endo-1,4-beta-xylanase